MNRRFALVSALLACCGAAVPALAETILVPQDQPTITAAIAAAADGDLISITASDWVESVALVEGVDDFPTALTLAGAGMFDTMWDAGGAGPCLRVQSGTPVNWTLQDLAFTGPGSGAAGAVDIAVGNEATWTVVQCGFFNCPGNMLVSTADLDVSGCVFADATGLQVTGVSVQGADLTVTRSTFDNIFRGASIVAPSSASFTNSIFANLDHEGLNFGGVVTSGCNCRFNIANTGGAWPVGTSVIEFDPQFCGVMGLRNWSLQSDSPCADDPVCGSIGVFGVGCLSVSNEDVIWGSLKARFR